MARIFRAPEPDRFTILANAVLCDPRLSFRATGVLARLLSEPPDSAVNTALLWRERRPHGEGRDALLTALRELDRAGYLTRVRSQDERGRWRTDWCVSSVPVGGVVPEPATAGAWPRHDPDSPPASDVDHISAVLTGDDDDEPTRHAACG